MTKKKEIKKLRKQKKILTESLNTSIDQLEKAAEDLIASANLISYMNGKIDAYRDCLGLDD